MHYRRSWDPVFRPGSSPGARTAPGCRCDHRGRRVGQPRRRSAGDRDAPRRL